MPNIDRLLLAGAHASVEASGDHDWMVGRRRLESADQERPIKRTPASSCRPKAHRCECWPPTSRGMWRSVRDGPAEVGTIQEAASVSTPILGSGCSWTTLCSRFLGTFTLCLIVGCRPASTSVSENSTPPLPDAASGGDKVSELIEQITRTLESGSSRDATAQGWVFSDGWTMEHPSGGVIERSVLAKQCEAITPYGWRAVPELLHWLNHEEQFDARTLPHAR